MTALTERALDRLGQVGELDLEVNADAALVGASPDEALDVAAVGEGALSEGIRGEDGLELHAGRVVGPDGGVALGLVIEILLANLDARPQRGLRVDIRLLLDRQSQQSGR